MSSQKYHTTVPGEHSSHSFGKRTPPPRMLPEGTLPVAVFSALLTALLLTPVILIMFFRNKTLSEKNYQLRERLGNLMQQIEEGTAPTGIPLRIPASPRTRYVDEPVPDQSSERTRYADGSSSSSVSDYSAIAAPTSSPAAGTVNEETIAAAVGMTVAEIRALRRDMRLFPNGMRLTEDADGNRVFERDVLAQNLQNGFNLFVLGQKRDAEAIFDMIAGARPQWPYGHFFAAIAGGDHEKMEKAVRLFSTARAIGAMTPEGELYSALASLFAKANASASASLRRIALAPSDGAPLQIGPVYAPSSAPAAILAKLRSVQGVLEVRTIDW